MHYYIPSSFILLLLIGRVLLMYLFPGYAINFRSIVKKKNMNHLLLAWESGTPKQAIPDNAMFCCLLPWDLFLLVCFSFFLAINHINTPHLLNKYYNLQSSLLSLIASRMRGSTKAAEKDDLTCQGQTCGLLLVCDVKVQISGWWGTHFDGQCN